ncbi:hypothetical protein ACSQ6I_20530 [Anabaena sp. WFMT]|uniref:hypothetical protein n=1 Tax=Anabaena sp. WFMT TaxID=3449730 RepID=UPI003F1F3158
MTISIFFADARCSFFLQRSMVNQAVHYAEQFPVAIKQSTKALTIHICDGQSLRLEILNLVCTQAAIFLENAQLQLRQSEKMSLRNLVVGVTHENHSPVGLNTVNLQTVLNEVFHVHS